MTRWLMALLVAASLAGCAEDSAGPTEIDLADIPAEQRDLTIDLLPTDSVSAPDWQVGDWFGHHIFFGPQDPTGTHVNVIVTEAGPAGYHLVTDDPSFARFETVLDIPIVGALDVDLDTTAFGGGWQIYDFPMTNGSTWQGQITLDAGLSYDLTYTATFAEGFRTQYGDRPGFEIVGVDADGNRIIKTDYVPAIGWYTEFISYDLSTPAEDDELFRAISMGVGENWSGSYVEYDGTLLMEDFGFFGPVAGSQSPGTVRPFDVSADASHLMWLQFCFAVAGVSDARLIQPDGAMHTCQSTDIPTTPDPNGWGGSGSGNFYELPDPMAGTWQLARGHAGFVAGAGFEIWELVELPGTL